MNSVTIFLDQLGFILWGWPMLVLLSATGVYLTFMLRGLQFSLLPQALRMVLKPRQGSAEGDGEITHFQALMTALCATVGTGNIAGVATAIAAGGPGAVFWMWAIGLLGMATKYAEAVLGVHYRVKENGEMSGGPMYYVLYGLKQKWLANLLAVLLVFGALGVGAMVQSNSVADALKTTFEMPFLSTGVIISLLAALVILGGIQRIAKVSTAVAPTMIIIYIAGSLAVIFYNAGALPAVFSAIFSDAFTGTAAAGGFAGAVIKEVMSQGLSRGVFSNESGMGSGAIAAAAAKTKHPVEQALISMTQTFIDTIVVCTMTALVILSSGMWQSGETGATLTALSFSSVMTFNIWDVALGNALVSLCLIFFAFSSILGWGYYGQKGVTFAMGRKWVMPFNFIYIAAIFLGALVELQTVWHIAEICIGLIIIPNVIALLCLSRHVKRLTVDYFRNQKDHYGYQVKPFYHGKAGKIK